MLNNNINYDTVKLSTNYNGYTLGYNTYLTSGNYMDTLYSSGGCDSIVSLHLTLPTLTINYDTVAVATSCTGYTLGNNTYFSGGDYIDTLYSLGGCDSIVSLHLILLPAKINYDTITLSSNCNGYTFGNNTDFSSGDYIDTLHSISGCDSIVSLHLTLPALTITYDTVTSSSCTGTYTANNNIYSTSGDYIDTLHSVGGCDSIVSLHLTIILNKTEIVTTLADTGAGSLRGIIATACTGDTIRFAPALINNGSATIILDSEIALSNNIVFKGLYNSNGDTLYISGNNTNRIFDATNITGLVLDSMVLINGNSGGDGGAVSMTSIDHNDSILISNSVIRNSISNGTNGGGAIYCDNNIIMINSMVSNNSAPNGGYNGGGGGIFANGYATVTNSTITNNTAKVFGGGIYAYNNATVINSNIINNVATQGSGGGIYIYSYYTVPFTSVIASNSTISNNSTFGGSGGGISADNNLIVTNCTITNNFGSTGAGISTQNNATVTNSTITNNRGYGGSGVWAAGSLTTTSSIIAANSGGDISVPSTITSGGYNIFTAVPSGTVCSDQTGITATQLNLGPLQNNGGYTLTMLPGIGSVAIDRGNPADYSIAQNNVAPQGIRDVGSAESILSPVLSNNTSTTCGTDTLHITTTANAIWSSAAILYSNNSGTLYNNSDTNTIYIKTDNNVYILANFGTSGCPIGIDSILVTVTGGSGNLVTATSTDSSVLVGPTEINDANCQLMALVTPSGSDPVSGNISVTDSIGTGVSTFYGSPYLNRVYDITPTQNASNATATITLYYTDAEMQAYNNYLSANGLTATVPDAPTITMPADTAAAKVTFRIIQYHGLFASPYNDANGVVVPITSMLYNSEASRWEVTFNVTGFSGFYAYTNKVATPLALTWQYITAIENGSNNEIIWGAYNSDNGGTFDVQSSINDQSFNTIASIPYNNTQVVYSTVDINPPAQVYYRIKYTDKDGTVSYSATKMINRHQANSFVITSIYPVPAKNNLIVATYSPIATTITYTIIDATGQIVKSEQHGETQSAEQLLDISRLNNGIYLIKVTDALGNTETRKFSKLQ